MIADMRTIVSTQKNIIRDNNLTLEVEEDVGLEDLELDFEDLEDLNDDDDDGPNDD